MNTFKDIKELLSTLKREEKLITEMFSKRKKLDYKRSFALELADDDDNRINFLIDYGVIRENGGALELDDQYLDFFEQVLDVNEEINVSYINENIKSIKDNIIFYFNENNENRKYNYLRFIKKTIRKIGIVTLKSVVDLRRNVDNTFKNEPNYKNKKLKLERLDEKRDLVGNLIDQTLQLIQQDEETFFKTATDYELNTIIANLRFTLNDCSHNLLDIERQIIDYLNQIKLQGAFSEKIRKLKYLRDHYTIEADTNIRQVMAQAKQVLFETRIAEPLNLSLEHLQNDEGVLMSIQKIAKRFGARKNYQPLLADRISDEFLEDSIEEEMMIDLEAVFSQFSPTSDHLFRFIQHYDFVENVDFEERVTLFCQMVSQFESQLVISEKYETVNGVEHILVYPK
ncbi:MAG: hypothetical protein GQ574_01610 [Crocinitomix sp.]|nr:hypothetical protein [Crocinitomix sp.]